MPRATRVEPQTMYAPSSVRTYGGGDLDTSVTVHLDGEQRICKIEDPGSSTPHFTVWSSEHAEWLGRTLLLAAQMMDPRDHA